jgi:ligand-binding sensor domain-containing protein
MLNHKTALYLISAAIIICYFFSACKKDNSPSPPDSTPEDSIPIVFDSTFTLYNTVNSGIPFNDIRKIISDWDNNIWLSAYSDVLTKFDGTNWTVYTTSNSPLPNAAIKSLACDKNNVIWVGTTNGLFSVANGQWTTVELPNSAFFYTNVLSLTTDSSNALWAIIGDSYGELLGKYKDGQWTVYDSLFSGDDYFNLQDVCIDKNNKVWVAAEYYYNQLGIYRFDGTQLDTVYTENFPSYPIIYDLKADLEGNIWMIGNYNYYVEYPLFKVFDSNSLLENNTITHLGFAYEIEMAFTPEHQWIVGENIDQTYYYSVPKAAYLNDNTWIVLDSSNSNLPGFKSYLTCVCADHNDNIWIGGTNGLYSTKKN